MIQEAPEGNQSSICTNTKKGKDKGATKSKEPPKTKGSGESIPNKQEKTGAADPGTTPIPRLHPKSEPTTNTISGLPTTAKGLVSTGAGLFKAIPTAGER